MPAYELEIDVLGDAAVQEKLKSMGDRALLCEPALHEIVNVLRESEVALWEHGHSWAPNAPSTVDRKGRNDPLRATGALGRSLMGKDDENQLVEIGEDSLRFGSKLWYAHFAVGTRTQPKRRLVNLRTTDRAKIMGIIREWILHGKVGAGV